MQKISDFVQTGILFGSFLLGGCSRHLAGGNADENIKESAKFEVKNLNNFYQDQFKKYFVLEILPIRKAPRLLFELNPKARSYRKAILREWYQAKSPNFSGKYFVPTEIGCGIDCRLFFVVDWESGKIYSGPDDQPFLIRRDSSVMIFKPAIGCGAIAGPPVLYVFQNDGFKNLSLKVCP